MNYFDIYTINNAIDYLMKTSNNESDYLITHLDEDTMTIQVKNPTNTILESTDVDALLNSINAKFNSDVVLDDELRSFFDDIDSISESVFSDLEHSDFNVDFSDMITSYPEVASKKQLVAIDDLSIANLNKTKYQL